MTFTLFGSMGKKSLKELIIYLNSLRPTIKFTSECSKESINFLGTTVNLDHNKKVITTLYNKPTDTHLFLHNLVHTSKVSPVKGHMDNTCTFGRICSLDTDFKENADKLTKYNLDRYPLKQLKNYY